jgi:hypothetical protein
MPHRADGNNRSLLSRGVCVHSSLIILPWLMHVGVVYGVNNYSSGSWCGATMDSMVGPLARIRQRWWFVLLSICGVA